MVQSYVGIWTIYSEGSWQRVFASPSRRRMDSKGEAEEMCYPNLFFSIDDFEEIFKELVIRDGEMVCVELVARDPLSASLKSVLFLGSVRYELLKQVYDTRVRTLQWSEISNWNFKIRNFSYKNPSFSIFHTKIHNFFTQKSIIFHTKIHYFSYKKSIICHIKIHHLSYKNPSFFIRKSIIFSHKNPSFSIQKSNIFSHKNSLFFIQKFIIFHRECFILQIFFIIFHVNATLFFSFCAGESY